MESSATNCTVNTMEEEAQHEAAEMKRRLELRGGFSVPIGEYPELESGFSGGGGGGVGGGVGGGQVAADAAANGPDATNSDQQLPVAIPREPLKTLLAFCGMLIGMLLTAISIAVVHNRVPDSPPLPDISLDLLPNLTWAMTACEILLLTNMATALAVSLLHRYRWVVLRRIFFIVGIVFAYRAITIVVTAMPDPNLLHKCEPKTNGSMTFLEMAKRVTRVAMGGGFSVSNSHSLCGDSIFSGHTASLTISYLVIRQYVPQAARPLCWISILVCLISLLSLILSHGHYTVDLIIGYWLASRLWWIFHTMAESPAQKRRGGPLTRVWWFPIFSYLEANVPGRLPCEMELPWRRGCFQRAYRRLGNFRMRLRSSSIN